MLLAVPENHCVRRSAVNARMESVVRDARNQADLYPASMWKIMTLRE
jgi:hypothetical protein